MTREDRIWAVQLFGSFVAAGLLVALVLGLGWRNFFIMAGTSLTIWMIVRDVATYDVESDRGRVERFSDEAWAARERPTR